MIAFKVSCCYDSVQLYITDDIKCGENKKVAHKRLGKCVTDVLTTFLSLLTEQIHSNMQSITIIQWRSEKVFI